MSGPSGKGISESDDRNGGIEMGIGGVATSVLRRAYDTIQVPPPGKFDSGVLKWSQCQRKGNRGSVSEEAWIPFDRFEDFLRGEQSRTNFQCSFKIINTEKDNNKGLVTRRYWCSYGPQDERKETLQNWASLQLSVKKMNLKGKGVGSRPAARTVDTGYSVRRGCRCHFNVYVDSKREGAMLISWMQREHVDLQNQYCHGPLDRTAIVSNAVLAPRLSKDCINFVERLLRARVPPTEILLEVQEHIAQSVRTGADGINGRWTRDMQLTSRDIRNIQLRLRRDGQLYHQDDAQAVRQWVEQNPSSVLFYQEQSRDDDKPFFLVVSTSWMLRNIAKYGHQNAICMDATHGTNRYGFQLFTWLVYDTHQNGLPVVWALVERHRAEDLTIIQAIIKQKIEETCQELLRGDTEFLPACFICDDSLEEKASISNVYPAVPIDLCIWHVRSAFNKNLQGKVQHPVHRALMNRDLGRIMYTQHSDPKEISDAFILKWQCLEPAFVKYYSETWVRKLEQWVVGYRNHRRANQNTTGAVERWHSTLKAHIRSSRMTKALRKLSWLVILLTTTIEQYFWCMSELKFQGRIRNRLVEDHVVTICVKAQDIPDTTVIPVDIDGIKLKVFQSSSTPGVYYTVSDWETDESNCTCKMATLGNLCKHQVKALFMDGVTETQVVKAMGRMWGSSAGGMANLLEPDTTPSSQVADDGRTDELQFHFLFTGPSEEVIPEDEPSVTAQTLLQEVMKLTESVDNDPTLLNHALIGIKKVRNDCLAIQARLQSNTGLSESQDRALPTPFELPDNGNGTDLNRIKSWHERMMETYQQKCTRVSRPSMEDSGAMPFERARTVQWRNMEQELLDEAEKCLAVGGTVDAPGKRKRRKKTVDLPKIGGNKKKTSSARS